MKYNIALKSGVVAIVNRVDDIEMKDGYVTFKGSRETKLAVFSQSEVEGWWVN